MTPQPRPDAWTPADATARLWRALGQTKTQGDMLKALAEHLTAAHKAGEAKERLRAAAFRSAELPPAHTYPPPQLPQRRNPWARAGG